MLFPYPTNAAYNLTPSLDKVRIKITQSYTEEAQSYTEAIEKNLCESL